MFCADMSLFFCVWKVLVFSRTFVCFFFSTSIIIVLFFGWCLYIWPFVLQKVSFVNGFSSSFCLSFKNYELRKCFFFVIFWFTFPISAQSYSLGFFFFFLLLLIVQSCSPTTLEPHMEENHPIPLGLHNWYIQIWGGIWEPDIFGNINTSMGFPQCLQQPCQIPFSLTWLTL